MPLSRVLEPEVMDSPAEAQDYDDMDHSEVNQAFVRDLLAATEVLLRERDARLSADDDVPPLDVLDLGTGTAQIPIELCRQTDAVRAMACDLSVSMLDVAIMNIDVACLRDRIMLSHIDAKSLPYRDGQFAVVISNRIVHHIPEPSEALREAVRVLAPGGLIFYRDLLRPDDDATVQQLVNTYASGSNDLQRAMFDASLRAALSLDEIRDLVRAINFPPETVQATSDRHWTWTARR